MSPDLDELEAIAARAAALGTWSHDGIRDALAMDGYADEGAEFLGAAAAALPLLIAEVRRLRAMSGLRSVAVTTPWCDACKMPHEPFRATND